MAMTPIPNLVVETAVPTTKLIQNILDADQYDFKSIDNILGSVRRERATAIALIGGGPSLSNHLHEIVNYERIIIAGSSHDYFIKEYGAVNNQDIYCMVCDPDPIMARYLRNWHSKITYLVCSQCDKAVFELLEDAPKKYIWHANSGDDFNKTVFKEGTKLIVGGCTIGTRAIGMAMAMNYRKIHLFGYDSCLDHNYKHHAYNFIDPDKESLGDITEIKINGEESPIFRVAGYMLAQIKDFQTILGAYANDIDIEIYGDGALAYLMKVAKEPSPSKVRRNS